MSAVLSQLEAMKQDVIDAVINSVDDVIAASGGTNEGTNKGITTLKETFCKTDVISAMDLRFAVGKFFCANQRGRDLEVIALRFSPHCFHHSSLLLLDAVPLHRTSTTRSDLVRI